MVTAGIAGTAGTDIDPLDGGKEKDVDLWHGLDGQDLRDRAIWG